MIQNVLDYQRKPFNELKNLIQKHTGIRINANQEKKITSEITIGIIWVHLFSDEQKIAKEPIFLYCHHFCCYFLLMQYKVRGTAGIFGVTHQTAIKMFTYT